MPPWEQIFPSEHRHRIKIDILIHSLLYMFKLSEVYSSLKSVWWSHKCETQSQKSYIELICPTFRDIYIYIYIYNIYKSIYIISSIALMKLRGLNQYCLQLYIELYIYIYSITLERTKSLFSKFSYSFQSLKLNMEFYYTVQTVYAGIQVWKYHKNIAFVCNDQYFITT